MPYLQKLCHNHWNWNCLGANVLQNYWKELVCALNSLVNITDPINIKWLLLKKKIKNYLKFLTKIIPKEPFLPFSWNGIGLPTAWWVVYDDRAEECTDLLFCCPKHGKQVKLASFPVSSYLLRVHNPRGQVLLLRLFLQYFTMSLKTPMTSSFLFFTFFAQAFKGWIIYIVRVRLMNVPPLFFTAVFMHIFCRLRSCHSNIFKCHHSQSPALGQLNRPIKSAQCSSFPYHKKPDAISMPDLWIY